MMKKKLISILTVAASFAAVSVTAYAMPFDEGLTVTITNTEYSEEDVVVNINSPIPGQFLNTGGINVPGYEMDDKAIADNDLFSGEFDLNIVGDKSVARYKNGSVGILHSDGTFEGRGYDGSTIYSNPKTGEYQRRMSDGTGIDYKCGGELQVKKPGGDKITVSENGSTTVERSNGLVSEHSSSGKMTKLGLTGSNERISLSGGGSIDGADGTHLEISDGNSFTFTDTNHNTYHIGNNSGKMEAVVESANGFSLKADQDGLTITPADMEGFTYEFDENGNARIPLSNDGSIVYNRDNDSFFVDTDGFDCNFDDDGNLTDLDDGNVHFALRVNPDGSIISGQFKKDENGDLVEIGEDGSGRYEKDGGKLVFNPEDGLDADSFEWFRDWSEALDPGGQDETADTEDEYDPSADTRWDEAKFNDDIEPLNINLKLYEITAGSEFDLKVDPAEREVYDPPQNVNVRVDKEGNAEIFLPAFEYERHHIYNSKVNTRDYEQGNHAQLTVKGRITETYTIRNSGNIVYVMAGRVTQKAHFSGAWREYDYMIDDIAATDPEYLEYLDHEDIYDLEIYPYDKDDYWSEFWIYYFTDTDRYQVDVSLDGRETGYYFTAGLDIPNFCMDHSKDYYDRFTDEVGGMWIKLFQGDPTDEWQLEKTESSVIENRKMYGVTAD